MMPSQEMKSFIQVYQILTHRNISIYICYALRFFFVRNDRITFIIFIIFISSIVAAASTAHLFLEFYLFIRLNTVFIKPMCVQTLKVYAFISELEQKSVLAVLIVLLCKRKKGSQVVLIKRLNNGTLGSGASVDEISLTCIL